MCPALNFTGNSSWPLLPEDSHRHRIADSCSYVGCQNQFETQLCRRRFCAADAVDCVRLSSSDSVTLLGGPEDITFGYDHVAGPQTTQEQFFRGLTAQLSSRST